MEKFLNIEEFLNVFTEKEKEYKQKQVSEKDFVFVEKGKTILLEMMKNEKIKIKISENEVFIVYDENLEKDDEELLKKIVTFFSKFE